MIWSTHWEVYLRTLIIKHLLAIYSHVITIMIVATFLAVAKKEGSPNGVPFRLFISKETDLTLNK